MSFLEKLFGWGAADAGTKPAASFVSLVAVNSPRDPRPSQITEIECAGLDAIREVLEVKLKDMYPAYPNVGRMKDEAPKGIMGVANLDSDLQVTNFGFRGAEGQELVEFTVRVPTNSMYSVQPIEKIRKFAGELGLELGYTGIVGVPPYNMVGSGKVGVSMNFADRGSGEYQYAVAARRTEVLDNLEIRSESDLAMRTARAAKAEALGVNLPGS